MNFNDPRVYRLAREKIYTIKACMPPLGTKVFNKLEQSHYVTTPGNRIVVIGTVGEKWVIPDNKLITSYIFPNKEPITLNNLRSMIEVQKINGVNHETIRPFKILNIEGEPNWAVKVPVNIVFQLPTAWGAILTVNSPGIPHGTGDYIVCGDCGGYPNMADRWVVNGEIFPHTYDMRTFARSKHSAP